MACRELHLKQSSDDACVHNDGHLHHRRSCANRHVSSMAGSSRERRVWVYWNSFISCVFAVQIQHVLAKHSVRNGHACNFLVHFRMLFSDQVCSERIVETNFIIYATDIFVVLYNLCSELLGHSGGVWHNYSDAYLVLFYPFTPGPERLWRKT